MSKKSKICLAMFAMLLVLTSVLYYDFKNFCKHSVPIFAYHRVVNDNKLYSIDPTIFEQQMRYLYEQGYSTMSLNEFIKDREQTNNILQKKCIITFDDGYVDNNKNARPIMDKFGFKGTIFVAIKFMAWPNYVTWMDLWDLKTDGWEIGSHTYNHLALSECNAKQLDYELQASKDFINKFDPKFNVNTLAYPFGSETEATEQALKEHGYIAAVTGVDGVNTQSTPEYRLYRVNIFNDSNNFNMFKKRLLWSQLSSWTRTYGIDITRLRELL
ncbi:MAG TPA: polysaccharide deacetylase family protein [Candidatus Avacidaminococcus intestinavium]|uniref:Polysaccharide deacetylase family protein n=1 Tax=Candidatus Avacidaminococcus intestinavium TaxID=2840684 RepID=A0A9D1MPS4_9FIRM|nr:polysaccharide deacetylase family protein [Candidatus Avacidaminococcus intestinavium]